MLSAGLRSLAVAVVLNSQLSERFHLNTLNKARDLRWDLELIVTKTLKKWVTENVCPHATPIQGVATF